MTLGERIRSTRELRELSQAALARAVGIQPQSLWRIESGAVLDPGVDLVGKLAHELKVTTDFLILGEGSAAIVEAEPERAAS